MDERKIKKAIVEKIKIYIPAIVKKFGDFMPEYYRDGLLHIWNYDNLVHFDYSGNVTAYAHPEGVSLPIGAKTAFDEIKKLEEAGSNSTHKCYNEKTLIENDNTFEDYINHLIISGADINQYFDELLLHEIMHFCGSGGSGTKGAGAFREGLNEYLTRIVAKENGFVTSGCGYPKEIKIAIEMQKILGTKHLYQIAFLKDLPTIIEYLTKNVGSKKTKLFTKVIDLMEKEFREKYYSNRSEFVGFVGACKKAARYKEIDYSEVYKLLNEYKRETLIEK